VYKNRVLRRICGPDREEEAESWSRLYNEFHNLNASPNIIKVIKSSRMKWVEHVAHMGKERNA
jgi:hypothetical protein